MPIFDLQEAWLRGEGTLLGSLLGLLSAAALLDINVHIWCDRVKDGYSAGAIQEFGSNK